MKIHIHCVNHELVLKGRAAMQEITIRDDFIKLGQAMKLAGLVGSGVEAKVLIQDGLVLVNGEVETRRGRKLVVGDEFEFEGNTIKVTAL